MTLCTNCELINKFTRRSIGSNKLSHRRKKLRMHCFMLTYRIHGRRPFIYRMHSETMQPVALYYL